MRSYGWKLGEIAGVWLCYYISPYYYDTMHNVTEYLVKYAFVV